MTTLYILLLIQGVLGAADTLWHHELEAALRLGEMSDLFLAGQKVLPTRLGALGFVYACPTLESVLARPRRTPRLSRPAHPLAA
jgi:NAD dependent epimerase/dehydratase family enzyme